MKLKKLFDPNGIDSVESRSIIDGNTTNILNLNNVKFKWAPKMYRNLMGNFWIPEKVDLTNDKEPYKHLTEAETKAYDEILSFLIFLDSIQTNNIANINAFITAPEIKVLLSIHQYQEAIHSQSYQYLVETLIPLDKRNLIYDYWRNDPILLERNRYIADIYQDFVDDASEKNFARVLIANYLLEGIYFYNGFNYFYNLASRNLMIGTSEMIRYINRDELTHCLLFQFIIKEIKKIKPDFFDDEMVREMFMTATEQEINWTNHIIGDNILGISRTTTDQHTKWLANEAYKKLGYKTQLYPKYNKNPYKHLDDLADTKGNATVKSNFFEATVSAYAQSSSLDGWDDF